MHLVEVEVENRGIEEELSGLPLTVVFAEGEAIEAARAGAHRLPLSPPFHVSDEDCYLVLPEDIGLEIIDIFADGDRELLHESLRDGIIVFGELERRGPGKMSLLVEEHIRPQEALERGTPYAETVRIGGGEDAVELLNSLSHLRLTVVSRFVDDDGLEAMLREPEHVGLSWRVPEDKRRSGQVDPTYAWSQRLADGRIGVEAAMFAEYEELVVILRPVALAPAA